MTTPEQRTAAATESAAASLAKIVSLLETRAELRKVEMPTTEHDASIEARKAEMMDREFHRTSHSGTSQWCAARILECYSAADAITLLCLNVGESVDVAGATFTRTK